MAVDGNLQDLARLRLPSPPKGKPTWTLLAGVRGRLGGHGGLGQLYTCVTQVIAEYLKRSVLESMKGCVIHWAASRAFTNLFCSSRALQSPRQHSERIAALQGNPQSKELQGHHNAPRRMVDGLHVCGQHQASFSGETQDLEGAPLLCNIPAGLQAARRNDQTFLRLAHQQHHGWRQNH